MMGRTAQAWLIPYIAVAMVVMCIGGTTADAAPATEWIQPAFIETVLPAPGQRCGNAGGVCSAKAAWCGVKTPVRGQCAGTAVCCTPRPAAASTPARPAVVPPPAPRVTPATPAKVTPATPAKVTPAGGVPCLDARKNRVRCVSPSDTSSLGPNPYALGANAVCVCTDPAPSNPAAVNRQRGPMIVRQLLAGNLGLTVEKATAIVANMFIESPGMLPNRNEARPACTNAGWKKTTSSACGFGWVQWTNVRRTAYFEYCESQRMTPGTDRSNYAYLTYEFKNAYSFTNARGQRATDGTIAQVFRNFVAGTGGFASCRDLTCWTNKWRDLYERPSAAAVRAHPNERSQAAAQLWAWVQDDIKNNVRTLLF